MVFWALVDKNGYYVHSGETTEQTFLEWITSTVNHEYWFGINEHIMHWYKK